MKTPPETDPLLAAADVLETESNELARLLDAEAFKAMNYRVDLAVRYEMSRLREIASALRAKAPKSSEDE